MANQYFLYFGVMGMVLPYFNLYCYHLGFDGFQIGVLSSIRSFGMVIFSIIWGVVADRFSARKPVYILCNFTSAFIWAFYLMFTDYNYMVIITIFFAVFYSPIISFMEAFTMDILGPEKKGYGSIRAWGTIAFICVVIIMGKLMDSYPVNIILGISLAGYLIQSLFSIGVPAIKSTRTKTGFFSQIAFLGKKKVLIFLFCAFLMLVSHGTYYGFFSIHLENLGYGKTFTGIAWAIASGAEIIVMINSKRIFKFFRPEDILLVSFIMAGLRWAILSFATSKGVIMASQVLHAITYAAFHISGILYIDKLAPPRIKTVAQAVNNAITYGLGMMMGFFLNGYFFDSMGTFKLMLISSIIALTSGLIFRMTVSSHSRL